MGSSIETSSEVAAIVKSWRNVATTYTRVKKGDRISVEVEGGFVHREAPCDGTVYESASVSLFVPNVTRRTLEVATEGPAMPGPNDAGR